MYNFKWVLDDTNMKTKDNYIDNYIFILLVIKLDIS